MRDDIFDAGDPSMGSRHIADFTVDLGTDWVMEELVLADGAIPSRMARRRLQKKGHPRCTRRPFSCPADEDVVDGDVYLRRRRLSMDAQQCGCATHQLDKVANESHYSETERDGLADGEVLCVDVGAVSCGTSRGTRERRSPFWSGFVHRVTNCEDVHSIYGQCSLAWDP